MNDDIFGMNIAITEIGGKTYAINLDAMRRAQEKALYEATKLPLAMFEPEPRPSRLMMRDCLPISLPTAPMKIEPMVSGFPAEIAAGIRRSDPRRSWFRRKRASRTVRRSAALLAAGSEGR